MWVVYAYKLGDSPGYEDASQHVFGPFDKEGKADLLADELTGSEEWDAAPYEVMEWKS